MGKAFIHTKHGIRRPSKHHHTVIMEGPRGLYALPPQASGMCQYIIGEPGEKPRWCGTPAAAGRPYCLKCAEIVYRPAAPVEE